MNAVPTRSVLGLREVAATHDRWVFDQFGVLHDGVTPYAGAADVLRRLKARGDRIVVLGNSGKRAAPNRARLERFGFGADLLDAVVTSGDVTHDLLAARTDRFFAALGPRCRLVGNDGDTSVIDGLPIRAVPNAGAADFILLCGTGEAVAATDFDDEFAGAAQRGVPAVCANPDLVQLGDKRHITNCGAIARRYEQLGGAVRWIGKPYPEVYARCRELLGDADPARTAMVGDSLLHDVAGGHAAGWTTVLVAQGIHAERLIGAGPAGVQALAAELGASHLPDVLLDRLRW